MKLPTIRQRIDTIDKKIFVLLQERMGLALRSKKFKKTVFDPEREKSMLTGIDQMSLDLLDRSFMKNLLKIIMDESKRLQSENRPLVAFQGEHGAYGEVAARKLVPQGATIPCPELNDIFQGVAEGYLDLGVVPVESSLESAVIQATDLFFKTELKIIGEKTIQDGPDNFTRFVLLSKKPAEAAGNKTSIIFSTRHKAGSLHSILKLFADAGINLTRIASMPLRTDPGIYSFFLDFEGSQANPLVSDVFHKMAALTVSLKLLGSYPADQTQEGGK